MFSDSFRASCFLTVIGVTSLGIAFSSSVRSEEIRSDSKVETADFVLEEVSPKPGTVVRAASENLLSDSADPRAILHVKGTGNDEGTNYGKGTSSSKVRLSAAENLPLRNLAEEDREKVSAVIRNTGFFRRLPTVVFPAEAECYNYFLDCPESAVSLWRAMGISGMNLQQSGSNRYTGDVGDGTTGFIEVIHRDSDSILVYCDGEYKSPFLKQPIKSQSVLHLETNYFRESDDKVYVTHRADLFVTFPSQTVETISKVLAPLTAPIADRSFIEISMFLKMMSVAMERKPEWVRDMASRMEGVSESHKSRLMSVTREINLRAESRMPLSDRRPSSEDSRPRRENSQVSTVSSTGKVLQSEKSIKSALSRK